MHKRTLFFIFCSSIIVHCSRAQPAQSDTTIVHPLQEVITTAAAPSSYKASSPTQILTIDQPEKFNALSVSDAVKHFSGVQVKDYGGVGGLKTVSIRSLGANHTNVIYDGIPVSDYQSGQIDIGRFSLDNVEMITLNIGESDAIFQTAQAQSLAGTLNIITRPLDPKKEQRKLKTSVKGGSFGFINPALSYSEALGQIFSATVLADWLKTDGNYPFEQPIGYTDATIVSKKRVNSDVETLKLEADLAGSFKNGGQLIFKNYYYVSERGLPGPSYYWRDDSHGERLYDRNFFSQVHYVQPVNEKINFQANAKFNFAYTDYLNPAQNTESQYYQREYYLNATFLYQISERLSFSWANDGTYGNFNSNFNNVQIINGVFASRTSWLSALSGRYETPIFDVTAKLLNTFADNHKRTESLDSRYNQLSPYIGFSVKPVETLPVRLRGFYKNTFRLPTFGDIYYSPITNVKLKPENARQYDLGITWASACGDILPLISFSGDVYWNQIINKIVAAPTANMFYWSVRNYGKVEIKGMDLNLKAKIQTGSKWAWQVNGTYTYQDALNKTKSPKEMEKYNKRIIYTARHSASGYLGLETPWVDLNYNVLYCGKRYLTETNLPESKMKPFTEQSISLIRTFGWKNTRFTLSAECLNLFDVQYDVVNSYPMQGRSFRFGIKFIY
jgi:outer membrane cobalamin receptor